MPTKIEWTNRTWNPVVGCSKISEGCKNCYAEKMAGRLSNMKHSHHKYSQVVRWGQHPKTDMYYGLQEWSGEIYFDNNSIDAPLKWKKPSMIFVCSMGDLFHESVTFCKILSVFIIMEKCPQHTFQILTKRPERMVEFYKMYKDTSLFNNGYIENIWFGVTAENQEQANKRIAQLDQIPAIEKFVSIEPMLSAISISEALQNAASYKYAFSMVMEGGNIKKCISWVICGGETGHNARPMHPDWVRSLRDECAASNVPFFFKGWGEWIDNQHSNSCEISLSKFLDAKKYTFGTGISSTDVRKVGKKASGRLLDGVIHDAFPEVKTINN